MISIVDSAGTRTEALSAEITMPLRGNWVAHVELGSDAPPAAGKVTLEVERDGELGTVDRFVGTLRYGSTWQGRSSAVLVGGAGGLVVPVLPRHYAVKNQPIAAASVAGDVLAAVGEELSATSQLDGLALGQWTRAELTPAQTLGLVADKFGLGWRVLADGTVWLGVEPWPAALPADYAFEATQDPDARTIEVAPNRATLAPGMMVLGQRIVRVTYQATGGGLRAKLLYGDTDRDELAAVVRQLVPPDVYAGTYGATVVVQHEDDTLDVAVDDLRLPELRRIAFRAGLVGARVLFAQGARVRVAFESSSPGGAFAMAPDADPAAARGIARTGDAVSVGTLSVSMVGSTPMLTLATLFGTTGPAASISIAGVISSGSTENLIR